MAANRSEIQSRSLGEYKLLAPKPSLFEVVPLGPPLSTVAVLFLP